MSHLNVGCIFGYTFFQTNDSNKSVGNIQPSIPGMKQQQQQKNQFLKLFSELQWLKTTLKAGRYYTF